METRLEQCGHKPWSASSHQKLEEARNGFSFKPPTPFFQSGDSIFGLQASRTVRE